MLKDGLYTRFPKPDFALALHCRPDEPVGTVRYCSGPHARQLDVGHRHHSRQGGPRRLAAPHDRPDRPGRPGRRRSPDDRQPRDRAERAGGRDRRLDPRRNQAQHHPRRSQAPAHPADLQRARPLAVDRIGSSGGFLHWPRRTRLPNRPSRSRKAPRRRSTPPSWSTALSLHSNRHLARQT